MSMERQQIPDPLYTLRGDMEAIHCLFYQLGTDSEYILASTQNGTIYKWNLQTCREDFRFQVGDDACLSINYIDNLFISQTKGGEIKFWEETNGTWELKAKVFSEYWGFCKIDTFSGKFLVCPESGSNIRIVDLNGKIVRRLCNGGREKCGEIMAIKCFSLLGTEYIFVLCENGILTMFKACGGKVCDLKVMSDCPMALDFDGESKGIVGGSGDVLVGFELTSDLQLVKGRQAVITNKGVSCVAIRPDKKLFAAGCWDCRLRLFSMKSFKLLVVLQNHKEVIQDICYSSAKVNSFNSQWLLAAAGKDGRITLWDLYS
ncbi:guanine nucleotide-binding protein subunit beta-like protein 1 isoform X1 [Homalodisca vitripennis]|uniref:guanine nucleotide-binding protein subunit beta-like protein 1 isoform X1 n=2 Tax=Homalodisca vitripennis TaxID=197043 RepID=UPI001EEA0B4E|nr:guanine nucleotide-binding protein subunit beta-like protein 1 isoform X1 [Homalodisca vitripennis]